MKYTTIYELKDGDIAIKFGEQQEDIDGVVRQLTIRLEGATMNILENGELIEAKALARRILDEF